MDSATGPADRARAAVALILVQVFFGVHFLAAKLVIEEVSPRTWAVLRATFATLVLFALVAVFRRSFPRSAADYGRLAFYSLFGVVINQVFFIEGLSRTTATHSSIIQTSIPVSTLLFAVMLGRESLNWRKVLALAIAFTGVMLVIRPGPSATLTGDLLTLVNALSYALFLVLSKRLLARVDPVGATALLMGFGSLGILLVGWSELVRFDPAAVPSHTWALAAFIVIFPTALAYLLSYWALKRLDPSVVSLFMYLQPVIAAALAAWFLKERPGWNVLFGALLVFAGVHLALRKGSDLST